MLRMDLFKSEQTSEDSEVSLEAHLCDKPT